MSVDTNVKGKNLAPYRRYRHNELRVLVSPRLAGLASRMRIDVGGALRRSLAVHLQE